MLRRIADVISLNRKYFTLSTILLVMGSAIGFFNAGQVEQIVNQALEQLQKIQREFMEDPSTLHLFWFIFKNNVMAAMQMLAFGVFFGVFPVVALLINGILIGYVLQMGQVSGTNPLEMLVYGILPHGLFELFAVLLATTIGLRYGVLSARFLGALLRPGHLRSVRTEYGEHVRYLPLMVLVIIVLLFVAAVIESTFTRWLVEMMFDSPLTK